MRQRTEPLTSYLAQVALSGFFVVVVVVVVVFSIVIWLETKSTLKHNDDSGTRTCSSCDDYVTKKPVAKSVAS